MIKHDVKSEVSKPSAVSCILHVIFWTPEQWNPALKGYKAALSQMQLYTHDQFESVSSVSVLTPGFKAAKSSERVPARALLLAADCDCMTIEWTSSVSSSQFF